MANRNRLLLLSLVFLLALAFGACNPAAAEPTATPPPPTTDTPVPPTDTPVPTETPLPPTDTPEPTETPTPTETFTPTPDLAATADFESTQAAEAALEQIYGVLEDISYAPDSGYLAWSSADPVDLRINTYNTFDYWPVDDGEDFDNFIMHADVTWESTSGLAICGVIFRSGPNLSQDKYYVFQTIRLSGLPSWDVELWQYNSWVSTVTGTIRNAPAIDQENGATNEFILIADGGTFTVYANGTKLGSAPVTSLTEGMLAYYAWSESGETSCAFSNVWVWGLGEE